jgi:RNA polymerase sigma-70 factor (ECF subfamily)
MKDSSLNKKADNTALIRRLKNRDKGAMPELYHKYSGALLHIILRTIRSNEVAEEVLQDAFVKIWENIDKYDETKGRLFTWMVQICRNAAIDRLRSANFKRWEKTDSLENNVNDDKRWSESLIMEDSGLRKVVNNLDEKYSILIDYLYFQDYTQKEVSDELNIPLGTVKTRVRAAMVELRRLLGNEGLLLFILSTLIEKLF